MFREINRNLQIIVEKTKNFSFSRQFAKSPIVDMKIRMDERIGWKEKLPCFT